MNNKPLLWMSFVVWISSGFIMAGCESAPKEKIADLNKRIELLNKPAAQYFAPEEYGKLTRHSEEISIYMKNKDFKLASASADSALLILEKIQTILQTTGKETAEKSLAETHREFDELTNLLNEKNLQILGAVASEVYLGENEKYRNQLSILDTEFEGSFFYRVHSRSLRLFDEIKDTRTRIEHKLKNSNK